MRPASPSLSLTSPTKRAYQASSLLFKATMCFVCPPDGSRTPLWKEKQPRLLADGCAPAVLAYGGVKTEMSCNKQLAAFSEGGHPLFRSSQPADQPTRLSFGERKLSWRHPFVCPLMCNKKLAARCQKTAVCGERARVLPHATERKREDAEPCWLGRVCPE